jgi:predicted glycosyltransferase
LKILFYFGHPAQYLFLRPTLRELKQSRMHELTLVIKTKDVLETLLKEDGFEYMNILPEERGRSKVAIAMSLLKRNMKLLPVLKRKKPDLLIGTDASVAQLGKLLGINRITITEDDYPVIKTLARLTYPFTQTILCPEVCSVGPWERKKTGYKGYMKLAYLHPSVFIPDAGILKKYDIYSPYVIIRLAKLTAHHDFGIQGINDALLDMLIQKLEKANYRVFLSSEALIKEKYTTYMLNIHASDMHQILFRAAMLISDSQSMSVEAAMLGVPSLRLSDFAGRISVLEELEKRYRLTFAFKPLDTVKILEKVEELLSVTDLKEEFASRRKQMLADKINVSAFLTWLIENYPESKAILKQDPDYQLRFR